MSPPPYLLLEGLAKSFGATAVLAELTLKIGEGEIFALLGPSGSGKTTALRLLAGFETPDRGTIQVAGEDITHLAAARRRIGMVFQHYALFPHMTVAGNIGFGLSSSGLGGPSAEKATRIRDAAAMVELSGLEERSVTALSGGQQQRVALARALAPRPRVLLLDEPLSNLDPALRERTRRALAKVVRQVGITTVLVTHEQEEAFDLADRVGVLHKGRLEQVGTPEELYTRPESRFVAHFVGRTNFLSGTFTRENGEPAVKLNLGGLEGGGSGSGSVVWRGRASGSLSQDQAVELAARPESLAVVAVGTPGSLPGEVVDRRYTGLVTYVTVRLADGSEAEAACPGASGPRLTEQVAVALGAGGLEATVFAKDPA